MTEFLTPARVAVFSELVDREPAYACVADVDLVVIRKDDAVSVLYGRCLHRGALLSDGHVVGDDLVCKLHGWDYRVDTGVSAYANDERLHCFGVRVDAEADAVYVDEAEVCAFAQEHPQPYDRKRYLGLYADIHGAPEEPFVGDIHALARDGLEKTGHHGPVGAMGVPLISLPRWDDIQFVTAQLARRPLLDEDAVGTDVVLGGRAKKPLTLDIPLFVSDMSFGALSMEAKVALARGANAAGTGICSGEGGVLPEERAECERYFYELASARFGYSMDIVASSGAFHFKAGQGAKTGTGGHLPGDKVKGRIAEVRGLPEGTPAISPATFSDLVTASDYRAFADEVRDASGGIPIGFKLSAQHIEDDIDFALEASADYIILDGRGGGTGAAPRIFRDNISVPTIAALARARRHLEAVGAQDVSLIITGGLRTPADFVKALCLGADAIALSNVALQAIGCLGMRACHTNACPVGIATQDPKLRARLEVEKSARQLTRYFHAATELMQVMTRALGHAHFRELEHRDLTTFLPDMARLSGVAFGGVSLELNPA